jgi:ATP-dependent RNA helicase DeaD
MTVFSELGLAPFLMDAIDEMGFVEPTPIQAQIIPLVLEGERDCIGVAATGTGKTAAFGLPLLQKLTPESILPQALILCPTRELCMQITRELQSFAKHRKGINIVAVYGGASAYGQIKDLERNPSIVVGTPGRVVDLINRKKLFLSEISTVVLDEADEMLSMGFKDDLEAILSEAPEERRTMLFTATLSADVKRVAQHAMKNPAMVEAKHLKETKPSTIHFQYCLCSAEHKWVALRRFLDTLPEAYGIIFCRTRIDTQSLADKLLAHGYNAEALHGDLNQEAREQVMHRFRRKHTRLLVATDVAARGIDVQNLSHVFHFAIPEQPEIFVHRSGRTGRAGKSGISIAIASTRDLFLIRRIQQEHHLTMDLVPIPTAQQVKAIGLQQLVERISAAAETPHASLKELPPAFSGLTKEALLSYILAREQKIGSPETELDDINKSARPTHPREKGGYHESRPKGKFNDRFGSRFNKPRGSGYGPRQHENAAERPAERFVERPAVKHSERTGEHPFERYRKKTGETHRGYFPAHAERGPGGQQRPFKKKRPT